MKGRPADRIPVNASPGAICPVFSIAVGTVAVVGCHPFFVEVEGSVAAGKWFWVCYVKRQSTCSNEDVMYIYGLPESRVSSCLQESLLGIVLSVPNKVLAPDTDGHRRAL